MQGGAGQGSGQRERHSDKKKCREQGREEHNVEEGVEGGEAECRGSDCKLQNVKGPSPTSKVLFANLLMLRGREHISKQSKTSGWKIWFRSDFTVKAS
jgi:hypothetical protein